MHVEDTWGKEKVDATCFLGVLLLLCNRTLLCRIMSVLQIFSGWSPSIFQSSVLTEICLKFDTLISFLAISFVFPI